MQTQQNQTQQIPPICQISDCGGGICVNEVTTKIGNHGPNDGPGTDKVLGATNSTLTSFHDGNDSPYPGQISATHVYCALGTLMTQ